MERDLESKVAEYIDTNALLHRGDTVIVGLSGGVDSMVLCDILHRLSTHIGYTLYAAHMDHRLRAESSEDALFVATYCDRHGIALYTSAHDVAHEAQITKTSIEVAARNVRHAFFRGILDEHRGAKLALAHHMNDKAETMLMRLIRGTSIDGLSPMPAQDSHIIRPLMCITRADVLQYATEHDISWREDSSNTNTVHTRNYIRHEIVPRMSELNPSFVQTMTKQASNFATDIDYLDMITRQHVLLAKKTDDGYLLDNDIFADLHPAIRTRVIKHLLCTLGKSHDLYEANILAVDALFANGRTGAVIQIDSNYSARYHPIGVELVLNTDAPSPIVECPIALEGTTYLDNGDTIECEIVPIPPQDRLRGAKHICYLDVMAISGDLLLRGRRDGDTFVPYGSTGKKKLKKYFIDKKISRWDRDSIPIIATDDSIVWIVGHTIDNKYKITDDTACCLKITYNRFCTPSK